MSTSTAKKEWVARLTAGAEREIRRVHESLHKAITEPPLAVKFTASDDFPDIFDPWLEGDVSGRGWHLAAVQGWIELDAHGDNSYLSIKRGMTTVHCSVGSYIIRGRNDEPECGASGKLTIVSKRGKLQGITLYGARVGTSRQPVIIALKP